MAVQQRALLIGIDWYNDPSLARDRTYDLRGAVNDVLAVEEYLTSHRGVAPKNITRLLAPVPGMKQRFPVPKDYKQPTYDNIVDAFKALAANSTAGDLVYVHFSGHGMTATPSVFPDLKDPGESDECIVPCDHPLGKPLLRDMEIGALLEDIVSTKAVLTVVFDSCHSGGALRGGHRPSEDDEALVRAAPRVYQSDIDKDLPSPEMMSRIKKHSTKCDKWRKNPTGLAYLAACSEIQKATEWDFHGHKHGLLTYWLLNTLTKHTSSSAPPHHLSADQIHDLTSGKIGAMNGVEQTPILIGDRSRFFFGEGVRPLQSRIFVKTRRGGVKDGLRRSVIIDAGSAQQVRRLSIFSILSLHGSSDLTSKPDILGSVQIEHVFDSQCTARPQSVDGFPRWNEVQQGCPLMLESLPVQHKETVRFDWTLSASQSEELANRIWIRLWGGDDDGSPSFTVAVDPDRRYVIQGPDLHGLSEVMSTMEELSPDGDNGDAHFSLLLGRLEHLAKFTTMKSLESHSWSTSPSTKPPLKIDIVPDIDYDTNDECYDISENDLFRFRFTNLTDEPVGVVVFNFTPQFAVNCIYPYKANQSYVHLGPKDSASDTHWTTPCCFTIPDCLRRAASSGGGTEVIDTLKVIVSSPPLKFDIHLSLQTLAEAEGHGFRGGREDFEADVGIMEDFSDSSRCGMFLKSMQDRSLPANAQPWWQVTDLKFRTTL